MIIDVFCTILLILFSIWSFRKGWIYPYDKSYSAWDMKKSYFVMSIGTFFIGLLLLLGKIHVAQFFD